MDKQQKKVARLSLRWHRAPYFDAKHNFVQLQSLVAGLPLIELFDGDDGAYPVDGDEEGFYYDLWVRHNAADYDRLARAVQAHGIACMAEDESLLDGYTPDL